MRKRVETTFLKANYAKSILRYLPTPDPGYGSFTLTCLEHQALLVHPSN